MKGHIRFELPQKVERICNKSVAPATVIGTANQFARLSGARGPGHIRGALARGAPRVSNWSANAERNTRRFGVRRKLGEPVWFDFLQVGSVERLVVQEWMLVFEYLKSTTLETLRETICSGTFALTPLRHWLDHHRLNAGAVELNDQFS